MSFCDGEIQASSAVSGVHSVEEGTTDVETGGSSMECRQSAASNDGSSSAGAAAAGEVRAVVCAFFLQGRCRFGDKCRNQHTDRESPLTVDAEDGEEKKTEAVLGLSIDAGCDVPKNENQSSAPLARVNPAAASKTWNMKSPMRTAADVISRIRWDATFKELRPLITVGYHDRFYGTLERTFDSFNWEDDLASVGDNDLAIPQHRILFFRYRGEKIWDKNSRLDLVFGSAGQGRSGAVEDVLHEIDEEFFTKIRNAVINFTDTVDAENRYGYGAGYEEYDDDDDEDGDIANIVTGTGFGEAVRQEQSASYDLDDRSTHFLAIKITAEDIVRNAQQVQGNAIRLEPILKDCCMKEGLFHITICMLRFEGPSAGHHARLLLEESVEELRRIVAENVQPIEIRGLKTFGNRVLYAGVVPPLNFWTIEAFLRNTFSRPDLGIKLNNHFEFVPHMTLMKVSRPIARERRTKYLDPALYVKYVDLDFGKQPMNNLNVCIIDESTRSDGFYRTLGDVSLI